MIKEIKEETAKDEERKEIEIDNEGFKRFKRTNLYTEEKRESSHKQVSQ